MTTRKLIGRVLKTLAAGAVALLPAVQASGTMKNLAPEQSVANEIAVPQGSLEVRLGVGNPQGVYRLGDTLELSVRTNKPAYVTVLNVGTSGATTVLYPYLDGTDNLVRPGFPVWIAGGNSGVTIRFQAPAGVELVKAFASTERIPLLDPSQITRVTSRIGQAASVARNLVPGIQQTIDSSSGAAEWAMDTVTVTSVADAMPVVVDAGQTVSVSQPFGLTLRTDKLVYAFGEPVDVSVTPARACNLTVYNIGTSGAVRQLFPNAARPGHAVAAGEMVRIPGGNQLLASVGPSGVESLVALCTSNATATLGGAGAFIDQLFPKVGDWRALSARDLSVIATPGDAMLGHGATARAVAAILVR